MNDNPGPAKLDRPRTRRDAAKVLAMALQVRYRKLLEASGEDEIVIATTDLAQCMYENVEFVMWALKSIGGLNPPPPDSLKKITPPQPAPDPRFQKPPPLILANPTSPECTCSPLDAGIIGRERHMTSCALFIPT